MAIDEIGPRTSAKGSALRSTLAGGLGPGDEPIGRDRPVLCSHHRSMDSFTYIETSLRCEDVPVSAIAESAGTPCYVYSRATVLAHFDRLTKAFAPLDPLLCFAIKSCPNLSICRLLAERGAGMDIVSGGELQRALAAGVDPGTCVYAGVGKTDVEIVAALEAGVGWFNIESEQELRTINRLAADTGLHCRAALRVNPDIDGNTHKYTTTGTRTTKFGVDIARARAVFEAHGANQPCSLEGIHLHLGSPIYSADPYERGVAAALGLIDQLAADGIAVTMLDLGGGFGADYVSGQSPSAADYAGILVPLLEERVKGGLRIVMEPGRSIVANAGVLLVRVTYTKDTGDKRFIICDGGMNVLLRPSHYEAFHFMWPACVAAEHVPPRRAESMDLPGLQRVDVVGPVCETGDFLALDRELPPMQRGDLLAVFTAGAYGMSMANHYNSLPLPAEVLVDGDTVTVIRRRETYDDLMAHERVPAPLDVRIPAGR